ncbi:hypothetical protein EON80_09940 [bacterium]|nr:MAG: hypothetical protein EON80_09940 [bacterium]
MRLEGTPAQPARVSSPELDVTAQVIAFDIAKGAPSEVRAQNSVNLKLNLPARPGGEATRIDVRCANATLTPRPFKLVLKGKLNGFYQIGNGAKTTLTGETATFTRTDDKNIIADVTGGITLNVPAEALGRPDALGDLTITAQRGRINQADGSATFSGNARAISKGANAFDVSAAEFVLTRTADGTISTLKTSGRTLVKLDLPPEPVTAPAEPGANPSLGKPTHVEIAADGAVIDRATSTGTFDGNVKGFYTLNPVNGVTQPYNFVGTRAVVRYVAPTAAEGNALSGLSVDVKGAPLTIEAPSFNFGF